MKVLYNPLIPIINFLVAVILGLLLRYLPLQYSLDINYKFFLHAHSHVAFLGWIYMSLFILILNAFFNLNELRLKRYIVLYWLTQISVIGMLIFFPIQGYALYSIIFSTLHIFLSYGFCFFFLKDLGANSIVKEKFPVSIKFIKASFLFLIISSIAPFFLGVIASKGLSNHPIYNLTIYFYLHFQYNGWFTFAVLGILVSILESRGWIKIFSEMNTSFWLLFIACIPSYILSTLYLKPAFMYYAVSLIAALLQVAACFHFFISVNFKKVLSQSSVLFRMLLYIALACFGIKVILQLFSVVLPVYAIRNFVIGYLHLTLLGFVSLLIIALFVHNEWLKVNRMLKIAIYIFLLGFIGSELVLFGQGFLSYFYVPFPYYFAILFSVSCFMLVGVIMLLLSQVCKKCRQ